MLNNLLEITCCWGIFYLLYWLFFRKETFFRMNRFYLLATLLLGAILPFLNFNFFNENNPILATNYLQTVTVGVENLAAAIIITPENVIAESQWNWQLFAKGIYALGVVFLSIKFLFGLWKIFDLFKNSNKKQHPDYQLIENKNIRIPFSFFHLLFWNKNIEITDPDHQKILQHELAHIRQYHSVDVVILELISIVFWWNPLVWLYKKSLRTIHEYLADDAVLQTTQKKQYGQLLIRQSHSGMQIALANNFIQSQLKNRIMMMMKSKSQSQHLWKYLMIIPVFGMLFMTFSCENANAQSKQESSVNSDTDVYKVVEEMPRFAGADDTNLKTAKEKKRASDKLMLEFIYGNITYPESAKAAGAEGMTVVRFIVDKTGELRDFEMVRSIHKDLDAEALRVAKSMPDWIPGRQRGKAVSVQFNLPIKFKLTDDDANVPTQKAIKNRNSEHHPEVDEMPYFPGCDDKTLTEKRSCADNKMLQHIYTNIRYPKEAQKDDAEGVVVVKFIVEKNGQLTNAKIARSVHPKCDEEVLRLVNEMPNWIPAVKDGNKVAVEFNLPVKFKLEGDKPEETTSQKIDNQVKELDIRGFKAFPNPASDKLTIQFSTEEKIVEVKVVDVNGQCFSTTNVMNLDMENQDWKSEEIDVRQAARGMLLIQMKNEKGDKMRTEKVILH